MEVEIFSQHSPVEVPFDAETFHFGNMSWHGFVEPVRQILESRHSPEMANMTLTIKLDPCGENK